MVASRENLPLLAELLAEQQRLDTPVARFSTAHDSGSSSRLTALGFQLIPLTAPGPGEQYAFEVDLDACSGCKACVSACHSLNGLDESETWRDVGMLVAGDERHPFQQVVTTACHHCADPACLNGCPVLAYEKDPVTGIVQHLDDQCIGCQYCVLKCPYDVPKYNERLGIVRKCDLCHGRLAHGEAPACAQACPTHAIRIATVSTKAADGSAQVDTSAFLAAAPDPAYTQPTTRYRTRRQAPPGLHAADAARLRPQPAHWPLAVMLTFMALAVGCHVAASIALAAASPAPAVRLAWFGSVGGTIGLLASVAHLGQPRRAWRIFLGWRQSWLSREALLFGAWFAVGALTLVVRALLPVAALLGAVGLFCSVIVYVDTHRVFWRATQTATRFFGSAVVLGATTTLACGVAPRWSALVLAGATLVKLAWELRSVRPAGEAESDAPPTPALNTARLLVGPLRPLFGARAILALLAGVVLPFPLLRGTLPPGAVWAMWIAVFSSELLERHLFFRAVDAPKMPGQPA